MSWLGLELNVTRFHDLMKNLIGNVKELQNNPPVGLIPKETIAADFVLKVIKPHTVENGGSLTYEKICYDSKQERANLIIGYTPPNYNAANGTISFIGSHFDVVQAIPEEWDRNPFELIVEGDNYYGRGTTDCLGHVALVTDLLVQLDEKRPAIKQAVYTVFIASEEFQTPGIGVEQLYADGKLDKMKNGPVYWLDSADLHPCMGSASATAWNMKAIGVTGHSGMIDHTINSLEMGDEATKWLQDAYYKKYPQRPEEITYKFRTPSTTKPTITSTSSQSPNVIPGETDISGDIRLTPFYDVKECIEFMVGTVDKLNEDITVLPTRGPVSKYVIPNPAGGEDLRGKLEIKYEDPMIGIACDIESDSFKYLCEATKEVYGSCEPYSTTGGLPLVGEMKANGYDIQITGYGFDAVYHAPNEYCSLTFMKYGMRILSRVIDKYNGR